VPGIFGLPGPTARTEEELRRNLLELDVNRWLHLPGERHGGGANLSFLEKHVERRRWMQTPKRPMSPTGHRPVNDADLDDLRRLVQRGVAWLECLSEERVQPVWRTITGGAGSQRQPLQSISRGTAAQILPDSTPWGEWVNPVSAPDRRTVSPVGQVDPVERCTPSPVGNRRKCCRVFQVGRWPKSGYCTVFQGIF
jgi:hypothetical protein